MNESKITKVRVFILMQNNVTDVINAIAMRWSRPPMMLNYFHIELTQGCLLQRVELASWTSSPTQHGKSYNANPGCVRRFYDRNRIERLVLLQPAREHDPLKMEWLTRQPRLQTPRIHVYGNAYFNEIRNKTTSGAFLNSIPRAGKLSLIELL